MFKLLLCGTGFWTNEISLWAGDPQAQNIRYASISMQGLITTQTPFSTVGLNSGP